MSFPVGTWRSLVAYLNGVQGVVGSNPTVPTTHSKWVSSGSPAHGTSRRWSSRGPSGATSSGRSSFTKAARSSSTSHLAATLADSRDMILNFGALQARRRLIAAVILLAGLGSALVIYLTAAPAPANPLGYESEDSKQYLREMEVYGGKANVLASEFRQWFESLWHGERLAVTVVCLTLVLLLFFLVASPPLPPEVGASPRGKQKPDRSGP